MRTVVGECIKDKKKQENQGLEKIQQEPVSRLIRRRCLTLKSIEEYNNEVNTLLKEEIIFLKVDVKH